MPGQTRVAHGVGWALGGEVGRPRPLELHPAASPRTVKKKREAPNRDRGEPRGSSPPTPPCIRVRTRRFVRLSAAGLRQPRRTLGDVSRRADFDPFDQRRGTGGARPRHSRRQTICCNRYRSNDRWVNVALAGSSTEGCCETNRVWPLAPFP